MLVAKIYRLIILILLNVAADEIWPSDILVPSISGVRAVSAKNLEGMFYFVFSGSLDATKFSSNMMTIKPFTITFSSTSNYPHDRSYYGMVPTIFFHNNTAYRMAIIFGGIGIDGVFGDFWLYFIDFDAWISTLTFLLEPSYDFAYTYIFEDLSEIVIFVLGGINNVNKHVNSLYR